MSACFEDIEADFAFLEEWEDKYRFVIDLGKAYDRLPDDLQSDAIKVAGCASQVWLNIAVQGGVVRFQGASDALIVNGLIAILASLYDGQDLQSASQVNAKEKFAALGLDQHLSAQRSNGLRSMISRVQAVLADASNS